MNSKEIEELFNKLFSEQELENLLKTIINRLLLSKVKGETLNPEIITHKTFIDISLSLILKNIQKEVLKVAEKKKLNIWDKILEIKLKYLASYILKYDLTHKQILHRTITKYILNLIKKNHLLLNNFTSTLNRDIYEGKFGKFRYPELYPFDKDRYVTPIPELKKFLNQITIIKKELKIKESYLKQLKMKIANDKEKQKQIKLASQDMKNIISILKDKYDEKEFKNRAAMIKNQHSRFSVLLNELNNNIEQGTKEFESLSKSFNGYKEKHKDTLEKENEIINTITKNLIKMKTKI